MQPPEKPGLLLACVTLGALATTQAALRFLRFQTVRRALLAVSAVGRPHRRTFNSGVLIRAVHAARRRSPIRCTCLGEALVAEALMYRFGYNPVLCIGASHRDGRFEAHAWLEQDNNVVIGGPAAVVEKYTRFPEISSLAL